MAVDNSSALSSLRRCLGALALPGLDALATLPEGSVKADELALEYADALRVAEAFATTFTDEQWSALKSVDKMLDAISGTENSELWSEDAVIRHPRWQEIRDAASHAMSMMGWPRREIRRTG